MAKGIKPTSQPQDRSSATQFQFVNYELNKDDKDFLKLHELSWQEVDKLFVQLVKEGYKVSFSWDEYSGCMAVWLIGQSSSCPNHGFILSSRASTTLKALNGLFYRHLTVYNGLWRDRAGDGKPTDDY